MKGLLDRWGRWSGDPDKNAAIGQGLLATGMTLMGSRGSFGESLGRAGLAGMGQFRDVMEQTRTNKQRDLQLKMMEQQMAAQEAERQRRAHLASLPQQFRQSTNPAEILAGGQPNKAGTDFAGLADAYAGEGEFGMASNVRSYAAPPKRDLREVGGTLFDVDANKPIFTAPKEKSAPAAVQEYEYARSQGYKGSFDQWEHSRRRAGATSVNVNTAKPLLNEVAEGLGKQIDSGLAGAKSATAGILNAQRLKRAIDAGNVVSGPGAKFRVIGLQLGQMMGVGGKDAAEALSNTRTAIQSMAQAELDAAVQMKGQGQITEAERAIIARAASGKIEELTAPEIRLLADSLEKVGRAKIRAHKKNVSGLKGMPGAAPLMPFYDVDEPPEYAPQQPAQQQPIRRFNPATGKIE